jgi:hypothetical protein
VALARGDVALARGGGGTGSRRGARRYVNRGDCMLMMHQEAEAEQDYVKDRPRTQSTHSSRWVLKYPHAEYSQ